ncbi:MAG TPA: NAD(P)-dependent oxidoreductase [Acidimicrobiales bacterium]|nr:NAD(P)-dependent oxidoreductase [Acidimicrobiales bacterium]
MTKVAFCGLGQMGEPMAARLLDGDDELVVWNRSAERADALVERGARRATSPVEAAAGVEVVVTMLSTPEALDEVVFGDEGVASGIEAGATLVEMSTVGPDAVRRLAERLPAGVDVIDAPVLGSVCAATDGSLKLFVGGPAELVERWRPVLERLGAVHHLGPLGSGAAMKLVANSTLATLMTGLGEALALADGLGLDPSQVLALLAESPIGATAKSKRENIETGTYSPNFKLALAVKDVRLVTEAAREAGLDLRVGPAAQTWLEAAEEAGLGAMDYSAVIAHIRGTKAGLS